MLTVNIFSFGYSGAALLHTITQRRTLVITLTTQSTVEICATYYHLLLVVRVPEGEQGLFAIRTSDTESVQLLYPIRHGNAIENVPEWLAVKVPIQSDQKDILVEDIDGVHHELHEVLEKLSFLHDDHLVLVQKVPINRLQF